MQMIDSNITCLIKPLSLETLFNYSLILLCVSFPYTQDPKVSQIVLLILILGLLMHFIK